MGDRWALFADAGWVFAAGSTSAFGERLTRLELGWEPATLITAMVAEAATLVPGDAELLRVYWYDGSPNRLPVGAQLEVAELADVKLRLGRTARGGQKGVDGLIIHDLITLAHQSAIADAVVVSGDEDLLEAIESAQACGTRVHLLEIPIGGVARALLHAVDRRRVIGETFWTAQLQRTSRVDVDEPAGVAAGSVPPLMPSDPQLEQLIADRPPDVAASAPNDRAAAGVDPGVSAAGLVRPARRPAWLGQASDIDAVTAAGTEFARTWLADIDGDDVAELLAERPYLPTELDGRLLRAASPGGRWLTETERRSLRDAFWAAVAAAPRPDRHVGDGGPT